MVPPVGSSRRLIMRSVVVLPQPDGPMNTINSPFSTSSDRSFKVAGSPLGYILVTFSKVPPRGIPPSALPGALKTGKCLHEALCPIQVFPEAQNPQGKTPGGALPEKNPAVPGS